MPQLGQFLSRLVSRSLSLLSAFVVAFQGPARGFTSIMRAQIAQRLRGRGRSNSLSTVPPPRDSPNYQPELARVATRILYRSPLPSKDGLPIYILNAAAFPDDFDVDYDSLLPYVLERLPQEDELLSGQSYEILFLAGGQSDGATSTKKSRPSWPWFINAYQILSRALRKRMQKLYVVHTRSWVRILVEMFSTIVSPKSRRKIVNVSTISQLALQLPIEDLLIPPTAYLYDRQVSPDIYAPYATGKRAFSAPIALPKNRNGQSRLPRVLRETTSFLLLGDNLKTEGIFRIPPNLRLKDILKEAYDRGQKFIVWKEGSTALPLPRYPDAQASSSIIESMDANDAYGVHLAASLIKAWYSDLRHPLIPRSSYADIRKIFGEPDTANSRERMIELTSPQSEFPILPRMSREIIVRHLLPLLSAVAERKAENKMTPDNLAVCFAPAVLCGEDPMEDAKMTGIIRSILVAAIEQWGSGLREACGVQTEDFSSDLQPPTSIEEYEDPLDNGRAVAGSAAYYEAQKQVSGIILEDRELAAEEGPPLPPRPAAPHQSDHLTGWTDTVQGHRPAPRLSVPPPRYSTVIAQDVEASPTSYSADTAAVTDGFQPVYNDSDAGHASDMSQPAELHQITVPKRKPVTDPQPATDSEEPRKPSRTPSERRSVSSILAGQAAEFLKRKPVNSNASFTQSGTTSSTGEMSSRQGSDVLEESLSPVESGMDVHSGESKFRKPSWPASARPLALSSLARPIVPSGGSVAPTQETVNLAAPVGPRRTPSPGLLERMSSFEGKSPTKSELRPPQKLNLKKASVDDLRKLYEERVGTARTLVEAGAGSASRSSQVTPTSPQEERELLSRAATS